MISTLEKERTQTDGDRRAYGIELAAKMLDVSPGFVRKEIKQGNLKAMRRGNRVLILSQNLDEYLRDENE